MEENKITTVEVTDEGIIMIDYLPADYEVLFELIISKSCQIFIPNDAAYIALSMGMQNWMWENKSVEEYQMVTEFLKDEYKKDVELIKLLSYD